MSTNNLCSPQIIEYDNYTLEGYYLYCIETHVTK